MKSRVTAHLCFAGIVGLSAVAGAQSGAGQATITGCVISEADYRKMHDAGRGGAVGTGVGVGNEFILTDASNGAATITDSTSARSVMPSAAGTTGTTGTTGTSNTSATSGTTGATGATGATAFELSGAGEGQLSRFVGKRVELTGMFKDGGTAASGQATGGPTAGAPPNGVDVGGKDLKLREFDVATVREAAGSCATAK